MLGPHVSHMFNCFRDLILDFRLDLDLWSLGRVKVQRQLHLASYQNCKKAVRYRVYKCHNIDSVV